MLPWIMLFTLLMVGGTTLVGWYGVRLYRDLRHFGRTAADASLRVERAAAPLRHLLRDPDTRVGTPRGAPPTPSRGRGDTGGTRPPRPRSGTGSATADSRTAGVR